jgi:hypothetical protein
LEKVLFSFFFLKLNGQHAIRFNKNMDVHRIYCMIPRTPAFLEWVHFFGTTTPIGRFFKTSCSVHGPIWHPNTCFLRNMSTLMLQVDWFTKRALDYLGLNAQHRSTMLWTSCTWTQIWTMTPTHTHLFLLQLSVFFLTTTRCFYIFQYKHLTIYLPINTSSIIHAWPLIVRPFADLIWSSDIFWGVLPVWTCP